MPSNSKSRTNQTIASTTGIGEFDDETVDMVHRENIRKSKEALEASMVQKVEPAVAKRKPIFGIQPAERPRKVSDHEISEYQGSGGQKQMQKAQARKRRQVRNQERSIWDSIAPKEHHGMLNLIYWIVVLVGMVVAVLIGSSI